MACRKFKSYAEVILQWGYEMAKPGTKAYQQEIVEVFYGINPRTKRVERVSRTRGGSLSKMGADANFVTHHIMAGRNAETEIVVVFHLTDVFGFPAGMEDAEWVKQKRKDLEEKISLLDPEQ